MALEGLSGLQDIQSDKMLVIPVDADVTQTVDENAERIADINKFLDSIEVRDVDATVAVDLGLSLKRANCNIGSTCVGDKGSLYGRGDALGNIETEDYYLQNTQVPIDIANTEYDIVTHYLGEGWCLPTVENWNELIHEC